MLWCTGKDAPRTPHSALNTDCREFVLQHKLEAALSAVVSLADADDDKSAETQLIGLTALLRSAFADVNENRRFLAVGKKPGILKRKRDENSLLAEEEEERLRRSRGGGRRGGGFRSFRGRSRGRGGPPPQRGYSAPPYRGNRGRGRGRSGATHRQRRSSPRP